MGGRSSGSVEYGDGALIFTGTIITDGGGFSSVRRSFASPLDLSGYAGFVVELDSEVYVRPGKAPLGLHVELGDSGMWDFAAALAMPFSEPDRQVCRVFLPLSSFDRGSRWGYTCSAPLDCNLDTKRVNELSVYVLFQEGPFEVRLRSIAAVTTVPSEVLPTTPSIGLADDDVERLLSQAIAAGGSLFDKGYQELCWATYATAAGQVLAAIGPSLALRSVACAGLRESHSTRSKASKAWILRRAFDAILADIQETVRASSSRYPAVAQGSWLPQPRAVAEDCESLGESVAACADCSDAPEPKSPDAGAAVGEGALDGYLGPFVGMGISGYNDLGSSRVSGPAECARRCSEVEGCMSIDYGARGSVSSECWLSTATRETAGRAYTPWQLYDYYERAPEGMGGPAEAGDSAADDRSHLLYLGVCAAGFLATGVAVGGCCARRWQRSKKLPGDDAVSVSPNALPTCSLPVAVVGQPVTGGDVQVHSAVVPGLPQGFAGEGP